MFYGGCDADMGFHVLLNFSKRKFFLETLIVVFENVLPKGFFWPSMKNFEISVLTANSRYLQTAALKFTKVDQPNNLTKPYVPSWKNDGRFCSRDESLLFLTALLLSVHQRRGSFRHIRRRAWAWPRPQNWFDVMLASPWLNVLWKPNFEWNVKRLTSFAKFLVVIWRDRKRDWESLCL